jgi:RNA polymerase sigma-70 factor (ECF subfamily)
MEIINENTLLLRLKKGDPAAFSGIFERYAPVLCTYAYSIVKNEDMAKDVVQHAFIQFFSKKNYRSVSSIKSYLHVCVYHRALRTLEEERKRKEKNVAYQYTEPDKEYPGDPDRSDTDFKQQELLDSLQNVMEELPPQRRQALQLIHIHGYKYNEVATVMGVSVNTVKTHVRIAMEELRSFFKR